MDVDGESNFSQGKRGLGPPGVSWVDGDGPWGDLRRSQPARRAAGRGQGGVGELGHADGAALSGPRNDSVAADVFGGVTDIAASGISRTVSDGGDVSRGGPGGSSASA